MMKALAAKAPVSPDADKGLRARIVSAGVAAIAEVGSRQLSIARIAEIAQVSRASIYNYFDSREALIAAAEMKLEDAFYQDLQTQMDRFTNIDDQIVACIVYSRKDFAASGYSPWFGRLDDSSEAIAFVDDSVAHYRRLIDLWTPYVVAAQKAGDIRQGLSTSGASEWIARVVYTFRLRAPDDPEADPIGIMHWIKEFLMPGLGHGGK